MKSHQTLLLAFACITGVIGCKPADPNASARQAAKDRLAAAQVHGFAPGTTFVHTKEKDTFPMSFPRKLTATERQLVGTWANTIQSPFREGPAKISYTFKSNGSMELLVDGDPQENWNGSSICPWQVVDGVLTIPNSVPYTYSISGNTLSLNVTDPNYRIKSMTLKRLR